MEKEKMLYNSLRERVKIEYKLYVLAFIFILIADSIGRISIPMKIGTFILFPIFYSLILGILSGPECFKIINSTQVKAASKLVIVCICPFIVKLGVNAGANIQTVLSAGPALLLQEIGNLGTIFFAMPVAILLGLKREAIGATHSINRESNLALATDVFGSDSPETRGSLSVYIVGGMIGTIYFGILASVVAHTGLFHPFALALASGVGAGIMMASATASLSIIYPTMAAQISALASASETLSGITGIYVAIFVGIPLTKKMYEILEPKLSPKKELKNQLKGEVK